MPRRLIYEIDTRGWLRELSRRTGQDVHLGAVADAEFEEWSRLGVTQVWLMGVWTTGPRTRACYLDQPDTSRHLREILPDWREEDVPGSPYAVASYQVPAALGGDEGLQQFRARLHERGMGLILDFVPNHLGLDHPWVAERPELFVQAPAGSPESFTRATSRGLRRMAHGKDPWFPAWVDTVQLDHRRADARAAIIEELRAVANGCDGLRCDMAMLLLQDVFARTWARLPASGPPASGEFWTEAMAAVQRPGFLWLAEAYWDLEERLQHLGFDLTYDKRVTDFVVERRPAELSRHLLGRSAEFLRRSVHFLENHDEPRIAGRLSLAEHRAAALLVLALPGVCLLHEGQLNGARIRASVHLSRRPDEPVNRDVRSMYDELLAGLAESAVGRGPGQCLHPARASAEDASSENLVVLYWPAGGEEFDLVVLNLAAGPSRARVEWPRPGFDQREWAHSAWLGDASGRHAVLRPAGPGNGIGLEIPPSGAYGIRFRPVA